MPLQLEQIKPDTLVQHVHHPTRLGWLTGRATHGLTSLAEVRWSDEIEFVPLQALRAYDVSVDNSIEGLIQRAEYEGIDCLRSLLTYEKLKGNLTNVVYSMQTADIDFYAHQFIPVLKFIQSPLERLLIADEVGLGKTIEAGLIWTECRARNQSRRLLVVCPPTLVPKWVRELNDRFDVPAEAVDLNGLAAKMKRLEQRGADLPFALVTSYHAIRPFSYQLAYLRALADAQGRDDAARTFDEPPTEFLNNPRFNFLYRLSQWDQSYSFADLVIFDEGHIMKNTATATHMVGRVLEQAAASMIVLSATPLTNRTRDLYALLRLVDPNMFPDEATYNQMRERNNPAVSLLNMLGKTPLDLAGCNQVLAEIPESGAKRQLAVRLRATSPEPSVSELIKLRSEAQRLNELSSYLTRTRKIDVVSNKVVREPVVLQIEHSVEERLLYQGLLKLIRKRVRDRGNVPGIFHLMASALSMSSCLPAMASRMKAGTIHWGSLEDLEELQLIEDAFGEDGDCEFVGERAEELVWESGTLAAYDFEANDRKYAALREELFRRADLNGSENSEKVIVFAFFKDTLKYLKRRLENDEIRCLMVTGDTTDKDERDKLLSSFKDPKHRVLLCSEVAAEGVDLQFCRVLVNYDLPWNPMRVEQRIGRIDRIGQKANSIVIINLLTNGTIDASIYEHLHTKIGLFTDTIGEVEGIIGSQLNALTHDLLVDDLTAEQWDKRIKKSAEAIENLRQLESEVAQESENLVGLRTVLQDSVNQDRMLGRYIKPIELQRFVDDFLKNAYTGSAACDMNRDTPKDGCLSLTFSDLAYGSFEQFLSKRYLEWPKGFRKQNPFTMMTFDPEIHTQLLDAYPTLQLVSHIHPFIQWIADTRRERSEQWHPVSSIRVYSSDLESGEYLYFISKSVLSHDILKRHELLYRAIHLKSDRGLGREDSESLIQAALECGETWFQIPPYIGTKNGFNTLRFRCEEDHAQNEMEFANELELRKNSKLQQVSVHYLGQITAVEKTIETIRARPEGHRNGLAGFEVRLQHLKKNFEAATQRITNDRLSEIQYKLIACGLIEVIRS